MSSEQSTPAALAAAVKDDLFRVTLEKRLATILVTTGVLAFGFMLGAHFMAADLLFGTPLPGLQARYEAVIEAGVYVSGGSLVLGVALEHRRRDDE